MTMKYFRDVNELELFQKLFHKLKEQLGNSLGIASIAAIASLQDSLQAIEKLLLKHSKDFFSSF